jgi:NAD(P)-dependent dehydrogenase (short-subunit alcohol dehydrogenase family)
VVTTVLDGRVVILTGATQGLGAATARLAAQRGAAGLVLVGRDRRRGEAMVDELHGIGTPTELVLGDLADPSLPTAIVAAAADRFGTVHGVVSSAALTDRGNIWDTDLALWDRMMAVNLRAPFLLLQEAAKLMRSTGVPGSIVNVGSVSGHGGQPFILPYCVAKGGLVPMTKNAAYSLMRHRIRVNLVNPGWMDTPAEDQVQRTYHGASDGWLAEAEARQPFGRLVKPEEVARLIVFLLSDESGMMTGNVIDYDQSVQGAGDAPKPTPEEVPV